MKYFHFYSVVLNTPFVLNFIIPLLPLSLEVRNPFKTNTYRSLIDVSRTLLALEMSLNDLWRRPNEERVKTQAISGKRRASPLAKCTH